MGLPHLIVKSSLGPLFLLPTPPLSCTLLFASEIPYTMVAYSNLPKHFKPQFSHL